MSTANPAPTSTSPKPNFVALDGSLPRRPSQTHSHANTGASMMMKSELSDWNQLLGNS